MKDDALAPVIAVMLILAAIVTFFSIYNAIYVPSMKESSEVEHIHNVESSFQKFSSDIYYAASSHQNYLTFSEPVQLGGGDFMFNLLKSSGTLNVQNEENPIYNLSLTDETGAQVAFLNGTIVNFAYEPTSNFWQDQGYRWQYGYLNVTKYGSLSTPLQYTNMTSVNNAFNESSPLASLASSFGQVSYEVNTTPAADGTNPGGNCSSLDLWAVNITASPDHNFISSNGYGTLSLASSVNTTSYPGISSVAIDPDNEPFGNVTFGSWNTSINAAAAACHNIEPDDSNTGQWDIKPWADRPVTVTLHEVHVEISTY